jgi:hypothetical protein
MEYTDKIINLFFESLGGVDFLGLAFGLLIVVGIMIAIIRPIDL